MATMNSKERAKLYLEQLKKSVDRNAEAKKIAAEIETLVWTESQQKLTKAEKLQLIDELEKLARQGGRTVDGRVIVEASDNSGIIDVISALKNGVKG